MVRVRQSPSGKFIDIPEPPTPRLPFVMFTDSGFGGGAGPATPFQVFAGSNSGPTSTIVLASPDFTCDVATGIFTALTGGLWTLSAQLRLLTDAFDWAVALTEPGSDPYVATVPGTFRGTEPVTQVPVYIERTVLATAGQQFALMGSRLDAGGISNPGNVRTTFSAVPVG